MRVLVTGATGFLGEHVLEVLAEHGGHTVRALARRPSRVVEERGAELVLGDVTDGDSLAGALDGVEAVFHLAGFVSRRGEDGQAMMRTHVDGTRRLFEAAAKAGVRRIVLSSSSGTIAVTDDADARPDESWPWATRLVANWPYYLSKIYQEKLALELSAKTGIELVTVSPSLLLGPGDHRQSSTGDVAKFLRREIPVVPDGGLSFVDVRDAARATVTALEKGRNGERFLLGGPNWTFKEFFGRLERASKVRGPWMRMPSRFALTGASLLEQAYKAAGRAEPPVDRISVEMGQVYWYLDATKAKRELGFEARDPSETLDATIRFIRRR